MRRFLFAGLMALSLSPLALGAQAGADPDKIVKNGGVQVKGWMGRTDKATQDIKTAKFFPAGSGMHVTSGPPATYWSPANVARGMYTVKATFTQTKAPAHPEAYGLFMAGSKMDGDDQNYLYCVVFGTGMFSVKHRFGSEVHNLVDRKASDAIKKADAAGAATNEIAWVVEGDKVSCKINGTDVSSFPKADLLGTGKLESTDGLYGIRVNHNLDVHIDDFGMTRK